VDDSGKVAADEQTRQRQAMLDAQYQQFLNGTMAGVSSSLVRNWPVESAVLAAHAKHGAPALFPYSFWSTANGPDLGTMVKAIFAKGGDDTAQNICTGPYAAFPHS